MNLRHAAALALLGWYLITPPVGPDGVVDLNAPISKWDQKDNFDAAADCDTAVAQRIKFGNLLAARMQKSFEFAQAAD
jgi:hypothetical protein